MGRTQKIFAAAVVVSLLVHLALMASVGRWWEAFGETREEVEIPLEARLVGVVPTPAVTPKPRPSPASPEPPLPQPPASVVPEVVEKQGPVVAPLPPSAPPVSSPMEEKAVSAAVPVEPPAPEPEAPPSRPIRTLPSKVVLVFDVQAGGINLGQATYTWQTAGERYRLDSVAEAKGLASLFMSGRIIQTSEGHIASGGLIPAQFVHSKKEGRQDMARFDWTAQQLFLRKGSAPLTEGTQDLLSFPFHLAMTVEDGPAEWRMSVTNGRKLKSYQFKVLGHERTEVAGKAVDTLHVQGVRTGEGSLDVWLAPDRHWLPVRILTQDQQGTQVEMTLAPSQAP